MHGDSVSSPWSSDEWEKRLRAQLDQAEHEHSAALRMLKEAISVRGDSSLSVQDKRYSVLKASAAQQRTYRRYSRAVREYINFSIHGRVPA
jgi:hypothetical protein